MGANADAVTATLDALDLGPEHEALRALCLSLAQACDLDPGNGSLWREYRGAIAALMEHGTAHGNDDDAAWRASVRAPMGNTQDS
jgi:hypothetical protein